MGYATMRPATGLEGKRYVYVDGLKPSSGSGGSTLGRPGPPHLAAARPAGCGSLRLAAARGQPVGGGQRPRISCQRTAGQARLRQDTAYRHRRGSTAVAVRPSGWRSGWTKPKRRCVAYARPIAGAQRPGVVCREECGPQAGQAVAAGEQHHNAPLISRRHKAGRAARCGPQRVLHAW
jgi:hypothetical protein